MTHEIKSPKKLIEVALPLDAINKASAREKSIRHGHPSTLHLWWARRPLAAARAVIFSQLVHDPEDLWYFQNPGKEPNKQVRGHWTKSRARLFKIIEDLVLWENTTNEEVLNVARDEIRKSWLETCELNKDHPQAAALFDPDKMPGLHDPFAGGGTIPLEAQRLGLEAYASDLNPVAVLINKAMIEIPPKFAGMPPVNPGARADKRLLEREWKGAEGLADDIRFFGNRVRDLAAEKIGHLYPDVRVTKEMIVGRDDLTPYEGKSLKVVAWLWARTIPSPNPAFSHVEVPLASTFIVSSKKGRQVFVEPQINEDGYDFDLRTGTPTPDAKIGTKAGRGGNFHCLMSGAPISVKSIREAGQAGKLGTRLMAVVANGKRERIYIAPNEEIETVAKAADPSWRPDLKIANNPRDIRCQLYGLMTYADLFTSRQLLALSTISDLITETRNIVVEELHRSTVGATGFANSLSDSYADAIVTYLSFALNKLADRGSSLCTWFTQRDSTRNTFGRQALPMTWDFAELNTMLDGTGSYMGAVNWTAESLQCLPVGNLAQGFAQQADSVTQNLSAGRFVSTDPPYYDNIGYADLSDFFYVWLRRTLLSVYPELLATIAVPKLDELVATPYRHDGKESADRFFLKGMTNSLKRLVESVHPSAPITIYYAFKQSEISDGNTSSTGWEAFLSAIGDAGLSVSGTWPMRTELSNRMVGSGTNALASSIVLVCRVRGAEACSVSRREFIRELNATLPIAIDAMTRESEDLPSPVAPVDLSQAVIGPGMAVFSKYSAVLEADGSPMTVRTALQLINRFLAEDDFDADTQFCLHWFDQFGWDEGVYGEADVLARAKATSVSGLVDAGVLRSGSGKVKLLRWSEFPPDWDPNKDLRIPIWEVLHQLIRAMRQGGESAAGKLLGHSNVQFRAEAARQLAYRLYTLCERKNWSEDARAYNELITSWPAIESSTPQTIQTELFE